MSANKDQKRQKDNSQDKTKEENKESKKFTPPPPKPFQQFSNPNKFKGGPGPTTTFHRRTGK